MANSNGLQLSDCVTYMGELLLNWLNDEIQLSKRISNFEDDFHNGFLFGELLAKYSQQLNFHEFVNKDDKAARINNFTLLLQTFSALKVTYDCNIAFKIINRQLGAAKKLLYELKTQLEKTNDNAFSKTNKMSKTLTPLKKIQISKEKFDQVNKEHFVKQLNQMHPAQKEIIEQKLLKKFVNFEDRSNNRAAQDEEKERQARLLLRSKFNEQQRENLKKSEEFRKQWESEHMDKWAANMTIRHNQVNKDEQYKYKQYEQKVQLKTMSQVNALKALQSDIASFQRKNINKLPSDSDEQQEEIKLKKNVSQKSQIPFLKVRQEVKEEKRYTGAQNEKKKHQREKRRRKMIVQQQKRYQMVEIARRERCVVATIDQTSKQEKEIQYEVWRAWRNKNVITDNKALFNDKINEKNETREINAKFKHDELLKLYREEHNVEVNAALAEATALQRAHQVAVRKVHYAQSQNIVEELIELTEKMYISCQERNSKEIDSDELAAALIRFVQGTSTPQEDGLIRLKHYIEGTEQWNLPIVRPDDDVPTDAKEDNALPKQTVNNFYLGNVLRDIFQRHIDLQKNEQYSSPPEKLLISLIGVDFSRKHHVASQIAAQYGFTIIEVEKLIESRLQDWQTFKKKGIEVSKQTEQLALQTYAGKPIDDKIIIQLINQQIQKHQKTILLDYPNNYDQAIELCRLIANIQPSDGTSADRLKTKIQQFERLVKSSESKIIARQMRECGVDFVWWVEVSKENSFDRMLGRRWIGETEVHIEDDISPYQLKEGQKAAALAMRNQYKLQNKDQLQGWFSMFGTQFGSKEKISQACWEEIDGNCDKGTLETIILDKIKEMIGLKDKQKEWVKAKQVEQEKKQKELQELNKKKQLIKEKCVHSNQQTIKTELSEALKKSQMDKGFIEQCVEIWNKTQNATVNSLTRVFQDLQNQQTGKKSYLSRVKRSFISLLTRQDHKFYLIKDFQNNYNKFLKENEDMLVYDYTKEELHQRVEDLENDLLSLVEEKKEDAVAERGGVMGSGWLESQLQIILLALYVIVQTELNRYAASQKLITDYYAKRFMANTKAYEPLSPDINNEAFSVLDNYKDGASPKLDKIISEALRILNREEQVVDDKNKKGGKAPPPKKDDKKAAKKGGKDEVEEVKEPTAEEIELKKAINTQKAILRQRLNRIKSFGAQKLKGMYEAVQRLYADLQDLYVYTHKVETKAVLGMTKIFRRAIQNEQRIENEVQIAQVQVTQTEKIRNFAKEKPIIQPAKERLSEDHFTLSNIYEVIKLFREQSEGEKITTKKLITLLKRLVTSPQLKKLLPASWKSVTAAKAQNFAKLLDNKNQAYVQLIRVFIFIALSGYELPSQEQLQQYTLDLTRFSSLHELNLQQFVNTPAWFDEPIEQTKNVRPFNRSQQVKTVLFNLFKKLDEHLQISRYLETISLAHYVQLKPRQKGATYFNFAFA